MQYQQYIIATGGVGVGKSTLIQNFIKTLHKDEYIFIQEYVDYNPIKAKKELEETLKGNGSVFLFQKNIIECYKQQLKKSKNRKYVIMERSPADSINIFAAASYRNGKMTKIEFDELLNDVEKLCDEFNIPRLNECYFRKIDSCQYSISEVFNIVKNDIEINKEKNKSCLFLLYCSDPLKQKNNIEKRGRPEEKDYDIGYMIRVNNEYHALFAGY